VPDASVIGLRARLSDRPPGFIGLSQGGAIHARRGLVLSHVWYGWKVGERVISSSGVSWHPLECEEPHDFIDPYPREGLDMFGAYQKAFPQQISDQVLSRQISVVKYDSQSSYHHWFHVNYLLVEMRQVTVGGACYSFYYWLAPGLLN
jgi:hypothetical protein